MNQPITRKVLDKRTNKIETVTFMFDGDKKPVIEVTQSKLSHKGINSKQKFTATEYQNRFDIIVK